ncbi:sugar ABC transporter permease [Streptosporangium sp. NPDC051022]|uniref:carbohydrate ABC transporter permease n=1 Tax=Streptosporangium sp. NPDC051022 TaxID=3155752 RepID=UPI00343F9E87
MTTTTSRQAHASDGGRKAGGPRRGLRPANPRSSLTPRFLPYWLLLPAMIVIGGLLLYPLIQMIQMSFQKVGLREIRGYPAESVGLSNYEKILNSDLFWTALRNTAFFALITVTLTLVIGTLVGLLLNRLGKKMSTLVVIGSMLAWATPAISSAIIFRWLFDDRNGVANWILNLLPDFLSEALFGRSDWSGYVWFLEPAPLYTVLILCVVWQSFPFIAVSVLAGLKSISSALYEAARVDGATPWRIFWRITFPLLRPVFSVLLVLSIIWDFKVFTQLHTLAGGVATREAFNLSLYAYAEAFSAPPKMGIGSAIAVVLTLILLAITFVYVRQMVRQEELR